MGTDTVNTIEWLIQQQATVVALFFLVVGWLALLFGLIYTRGQYRDIKKDRDWWREEARRLHEELTQDEIWKDRVIRAFEALADLLRSSMSHEARQGWLDRWRP